MSLKDDYKSPITIEITYSDLNGKDYKETFPVKTNMMSKMLWSSVTTGLDTKEATAIKNAVTTVVKTIK